MIELDQLGVFVATAVVLLVTPGPAVLYIVARSLDQGRLAGLVSSAGLSCGGLIHVVAATLGLSAVLLSSPVLFAAIKYAGAAYLVFLGVRTLVSAKRVEIEPTGRARSLLEIFRQGLVVNLLNPKAAAFFFAFLPQFVVPSRSVPGQVATLGLIFVAIGMVTDACYALVAGTVSSWLRGHPGMLRGQRIVAGSVYVALGLAAAFGLPSKE